MGFRYHGDIYAIHGPLYLPSVASTGMPTTVTFTTSFYLPRFFITNGLLRPHSVFPLRRSQQASEEVSQSQSHDFSTSMSFAFVPGFYRQLNEISLLKPYAYTRKCMAFHGQQHEAHRKICLDKE